MPPSLTARFAGMPRWAWIGIASTGIILGLYLRSRKAAQAAAAGEPEPDALDGYADTTDPGLAAALVPTPGGSFTPVESPMIPEGYPAQWDSAMGAIGSLVGTIGDITATRLENPTPSAVNNASATPTTPTAPTGGGPPSPTAKRVALPRTYKDPSDKGSSAIRNITASQTVRGKVFPGAVRTDPGATGKGTGGEYRWYNIRFQDGRLETWRRYENGTWSNWTGRK